MFDAGSRAGVQDHFGDFGFHAVVGRAAGAAPIPGVNGTTRTCELSKGSNSGDVMLLVAKKAHGRTRLAELDLRPFRSEVYPRLAQLLPDRL
ncbi:MAG: hypothetical protein QOI78_3217 [Actinomycetota bacterium]|nr:hypothetical protein [Actinomycetota bacterium]